MANNLTTEPAELLLKNFLKELL